MLKAARVGRTLKNNVRRLKKMSGALFQLTHRLHMLNNPSVYNNIIHIFPTSSVDTDSCTRFNKESKARNCL